MPMYPVSSEKLFVRDAFESNNSRPKDFNEFVAKLTGSVYTIAKANLKTEAQSQRSQTIVKLHAREVLEPAVANFLDRLFSFDTKTTHANGVSAEEQVVVDKVIGRELAGKVAASFNSLTWQGDIKARDKIVAAIKDNDLVQEVAQYYSTGLTEHVFEAGSPRPINNGEYVSPARTHTPLLPEPQQAKGTDDYHHFSLADVVLLFKLGLLEEGINYTEVMDRRQEKDLQYKALKALSVEALTDSRARTHFSHFSERSHIPVIGYLNNEDKARDILWILDKANISGLQYDHELSRRLSSIGYELAETKSPLSPAQKELANKIYEILEYAGLNGKHKLADENGFENTLVKLASMLGKKRKALV